MAEDTQVETLTQVIKDIVQNRKNLADQIVTQKLQVEVGEAQLVKFDSLIAVLQVASNSPKVLEAALVQEAANATVSPTGESTAANEPAADVASAPAKVAGASA
ncbi:MAG: hypothetical protein ACHQ9S_18785 [Candidatus Binatia bacterium]